VFDGVVEHFAEGVSDGFARVFGQVGFELSEQFFAGSEPRPDRRAHAIAPSAVRGNDSISGVECSSRRGSDRRVDVGDANGLTRNRRLFWAQSAEHGFGIPTAVIIMAFSSDRMFARLFPEIQARPCRASNNQ